MNKLRVLHIIIILLSCNVLWADIPIELREQLVSQDVNDRLDACLVLGKFGDKEAIDVLTECLKDESMLIRHSAANSLAKIGGAEVVEIFKKMLDSNNSEAKRLGLAGLAMTGDANSLDLATKQLDSSDWQVRWSAVYAVGEWGCREALPKLERIAKNDPYYNKATEEYTVRKRAEAMCIKIKSSIEWYRDFNNALLLSKELQKPIWIYWWVRDSKWCKRTEEEDFFSRELSDLSQQFVCVKLNVEENKSLVAQCEVTGAPFNIILDKDGREVDRILGYIPRKELIKRLKNVVKNSSTPKEWKEELSRDPKNVENSWYLAEWYLDNDNLQEAIPLLENVIKYDSRNNLGYTDNAIFALGFSLGAIGDYEKAIANLEILRDTYPKYKDMDKALYCLGLDYLSLNKLEMAETTFSRIVNDYPESKVNEPTKNIIRRLKNEKK